MKKVLLHAGAAALALFTVWLSWRGSLAEDAKAPELKARVFEMRTYTTHPGRLEALHNRFRNHTNYLFVKHGMTLIGYWTPADAKDALIYILGYPSMEAREKSWKAFMDDPEWKRVYEESHKDGQIVNKVESRFMNPTDYSPIR